jgi:hypothetical protein
LEGGEVVAVFYFNARNGSALLKDDQGLDFRDATEAKACAIEIAREILKADEVKKRSWLLEVVDENGTIIAEVPFAAIDPTLDH